MNFKSLLNKSNLIKSIFVGSLFVLIFISTITYKNSVSITESTQLLIHTQKVRVELEQLNSSLKNVEINQTSYFISRDSIFLKDFNDSRLKVSESINLLQSLTHDNLKQQNNLDSLVKLIRLRYNILLENAINLDDSIQVNAKRFNKSLLEGKEIMKIIRNHINKMIDLEGVYLQEQQQHYEKETYFTPLYSLVMLMFSLIVFIISYYKINKDLEALKQANLILKISTETMNHAEDIGAFSSWQWDLENNNLVYSENHHKLLGIPTQEYNAKTNQFLDFVHPDDRHIIISGQNRVIEHNQSTVAFFRVIRQDGNLRYFKSTGKFLTAASGNRILIGINMDVTEEYLVSKSLEDRNSELEKSNKELASFNHVASHDLQEPLRKIQTFISRIFEKEATNLSSHGKDYLERIQVSAKRMRILIDDLLLFSRTNKVEKVYERTDLNIVLDMAVLELTEQIEDAKAQIHRTILPTLVVIPFQIQQLFINLISNSIKYSRKDFSPIISFACKKINSSDYNELIKEKNAQYYKLSISDNGLGFKDEYKDAIFTLFYRLHNNSDYPGTGIGLAICKKIIENHKGFITAESTFGEGSTFHIFLPINLNKR